MRLIDADELKELFAETITYIVRKTNKVVALEHMVRASATVIEMIDDAPTVDAIPIEFIQKEIKDLEESLDFYGSIEEYDALRIDAMYQHDALTGLLRQWKAARKADADS